MYSIYMDGQLLFTTAGTDDDRIILSPKLCPDVNGAGSLEFVIPPGHPLHNSIRKLKSIVTVEQDGKIIFRGRVMDEEKDMYNQKDVYCEGDRSFLLDSQCATYKYSGTALELFKRLVADHNSQVDAEKQFAIGNVTAVTNETLEVENVAYWETLKEIDEKLIGAFGGYLMTRTEGGTTYLDWLKQAGNDNGKTIEFSVNMLDMRDKVDATEVFTILIPLGASVMGEDGEYTEPVNIASVNGGLNYIQDDAAVAMYGKIWRSKSWAYEEDPAKLLEKGREYLKTGIALQTITLQAIDMHFIDGSADAIRIGDKVRILSDPHGLDITLNCVKMEIDLLNPENTMYTFGEKPRTLSENVVKAEEDMGDLVSGFGGGGSRKKVEQGDIIRWAYAKATEDEARYEILTGEVSRQGQWMSTADIRLEGMVGRINLMGTVEETTDIGRKVSQAEIDISGAEAKISLVAGVNFESIDGSKSVSGAYVEIDGLNEDIVLKADTVYVDAEVTKVRNLIADKIEAIYSDVSYDISESVSTKTLTVNGNGWVSGALTAAEVSTGSLTIYGCGIGLSTLTYVYSVGGRATGEVAVRDASGKIVDTALTGYSVWGNTADINILTW